MNILYFIHDENQEEPQKLKFFEVPLSIVFARHLKLHNSQTPSKTMSALIGLRSILNYTTLKQLMLIEKFLYCLRSILNYTTLKRKALLFRQF